MLGEIDNLALNDLRFRFELLNIELCFICVCFPFSNRLIFMSTPALVKLLYDSSSDSSVSSQNN